MEIGIGDLRRGMRMIRLAQRYHGRGDVRYIGVDLFEAAGSSEGPCRSLSLKQAYRQLRSTGARLHLIPGDAIQSLVRSANALPGNELVLVAADQVVQRMSDAWPYIPRMLAPSALLFAAEANDAKSVWKKLPPDRLPLLASPAEPRRAAA